MYEYGYAQPADGDGPMTRAKAEINLFWAGKHLRLSGRKDAAPTRRPPTRSIESQIQSNSVGNRSQRDEFE